jgi:hypothetical protein
VGAVATGRGALGTMPRTAGGDAGTTPVEGITGAGAICGKTTCARPGLVRQSSATAQIGTSRIRAVLDAWQLRHNA